MEIKIFDKIKELLVGEPELKFPRHIAISMRGIRSYSHKKNVPISEVYNKMFDVVKELIVFQLQSNIRIMSFFIMSESFKGLPEYTEIITPLAEFFSSVAKELFLDENQVKVSVLGKWYDLPGKVVDPIKEIITETKDYDKFFLNFCINYDGKEEIVDACKLIARQVKAGKLDVESINKSTIKDNIYSSYFLPPEIIVLVSENKKNLGFLLWDSVGSEFYRIKSPVVEVNAKDILEIIKKYNKTK